MMVPSLSTTGTRNKRMSAAGINKVIIKRKTELDFKIFLLIPFGLYLCKPFFFL